MRGARARGEPSVLDMHDAGRTSTTDPGTGLCAETRGPPRVLDRDRFDALLDALRERGMQILGPTVRAGAIVLDEIASAADLPAGWRAEQDGGRYRLVRREDAALFAHNVGPDSWKGKLFPPTLRIWRSGDRAPSSAPPPPRAFLGVRSCDLHAIAIQDRVFTGGAHVDDDYAARRDGAFIVAVECAEAGGTCFCASMGTGPDARGGFDLALTELLEGGHRFLARAGTDAGREVLDALPTRPAGERDTAQAGAVVAGAAAQMGRTLDTDGLPDLLMANLDHPRWDEVADRCLTCGNCTMVCPTCFCSSVDDVGSLDGEEAERERRWESCFTLDHSYVHGGSVRRTSRARYRQWMTHKLATWWDQFGSTGCVGCGRCITWCPVAIDITEEAAAIRATGARPVGGADADHR
jgi:ferredoxin